MIVKSTLFNVYLNYTGKNWYSTDGFTDYAIQFIKKVQENGQPFFLDLAYTSHNYPLQAKDSDIAKSKGKYDVGYEKMRSRRF